jgi:CHAT domain-containing protein
MRLWPVSDCVTRELMAEYCSGQAQLTMLKRIGRQHPSYWANFIQSGEWANLDGKR